MILFQVVTTIYSTAVAYFSGCRFTSSPFAEHRTENVQLHHRQLRITALPRKHLGVLLEGPRSGISSMPLDYFKEGCSDEDFQFHAPRFSAHCRDWRRAGLCSMSLVRCWTELSKNSSRIFMFRAPSASSSARKLMSFSQSGLVIYYQ
jgi:hypothetical protein